MSAWSIGATSRPAAIEELSAGNSGLKPLLDKLVAWIPGDVVMLYIAAVSAIGLSEPSVLLLLIAVAVAPVVVWLGNRSLEAPKRLGHIGRRAGLAAVATALWALTVPGSGWQEIDVIADNSEIVAVAAAALGLLFGMIASILVPDE
ncbi:MAG: hypothetical protein NTX33_00045 [Propionibacteriales bacterium]|nr:hypothetical protein [Propionibacteriales bacterium]